MERNRSLEELENDVWEEPAFRSHITVTCTQARKKPLCQLTDEELRCMIGQKIGLAYLLPLAVERLQDDPLLEASMFPGDLLTVLLRLDPEEWAADTAASFSSILLANRPQLEACADIPASLLHKYI